jgi:hypothetical protein
MRYILVLGLAILLCSRAFAGGNQSRLSYLKAPAVKWEDNRLSGELQNVPVRELLADLLRSDGFDCNVSGALQGVINITFDQLTVEEIIRNIMRLKNYNFTLIQTQPESSAAGSFSEVSELTIYQANGLVRFSKVPLSERAPDTIHPVIRSSTVAKITTGHADRPLQSTVRDTRDIDREIRAFMDEMLANGKISRAAYDKALTDMDGLGK